MTTGKNIEVFLFFLEILLSISKSEAGGVLSDVLKIFPKFGAGCAYKLVAYKKTCMQLENRKKNQYHGEYI